jgi:hypothetical protein
VITRNPDHFHTDFHNNISEQFPFCTGLRTRPAPSWLRTPAMNTDEYPPSIHINNARTKLRWHGLDTTSNYCLAWDELSQRDCRFVAELGITDENHAIQHDPAHRSPGGRLRIDGKS